MSASPLLLPSSAEVSDEAAYTSLLEICTELIISEDTDNPPIHHALGVLHDLLHCDRLSGDATVLSVRAVRILLDKFTPSLRTKSRAKLVECVRAALRRMKAVAGGPSRLAFTFAHTKLWELQEELLQCMAAAAQSDEAIRAALPPPEQQLSFCVSVMDVSLDVCLQALRMCCVLLRSGQLHHTDSTVVSRIRGVFREKLAALESMEVSHDWLRLLRHVTEGMVTLRAYGGGGGDAAAAAPEVRESPSSNAGAAPPAGTKTRKRKRATSSAAGNTATAHVTEVETWLRICEKVCATPRLDRAFRSTVFGCASTVLSGEAVVPLVSPTACATVVAALAKELSRNARTTLAIMNPFVVKEGGAGAPATSSSSAPSGDARNGLADADVDEDEDQGEDLLNNGEGVQWHTPEPEWAVLVLIATLLAAAPATLPASEHMWWWVGDDDYARRFAKEDRAQLSETFFAAGDAVQLRKRGSRVKLSIMRESQWPFANACRVVFQPIPCAYNVAGSTAPSLQAMPPRSAQERAAALRKGDLKSVLEHIGGVARHDGAIAQYGRTVLLTVLLAAGPDAADVARGALRSFLADASTQLIETVSEALLRHDRAWASTLVEIGVTEAILQRSRSATPERSPVVRLLRREAASLPSTPPLLPRSAAAVAEPSQLRRILQHGSREEVKELLCALTSVASAWHTVACVEAVDDVAAAAAAAKSAAEQDKGISAGAVAWVRQLEHLVAGMVLSHLQDVAQQCQPQKGLKETVEEAEVAEVELCPAGRSPVFCCPQRHPLHHFHSANWSCNVCGVKGQHSAWSCRQCDYDLCGPCALSRCNRAEGAVTATAQDVLARVRADMQPQQPQQTTSQLSPRNLLELFTEDGGLISGATPLACLHRRRVHVARLCETCPCGVVCPGPVRAAASSAATATRSDVLEALLRAFGGPSGRDVAVQRCLLRAYESAGLFIFLGGAGAVPLALHRVTSGLAPHLPLAVKHLITRYAAVECRRFAFQVLHNQSAVVMSTVTGVTAESTKNHRLEVPREDKAAMVALLYDGFRGLLSPVLRVDFTFAGEEGFGSGPSQELYTELSAYFSAESRFWFLTEDDGGADAVRLPFPSATALFLKEFFVLGAACGRAFVDDFRMNLNLLPEAWELLRLPSLGLLLQHEEGENAASVDSATALLRLLEVLDPALHRTFAQLRATPESELAAMELEMDNGTPIMTHAALEQHIGHTILARYEIALENLRQFQWGLLSVLELPALAYLSNEELSAVVCGADTGNGEGPLFTEDELRMQTMAGNGYSSDSPHVEMFISIVGSELSRAQQRDFLEFLTGSPRLPFNGLAGLGRHISVAMRDMEGKKELTLPSCNTCFLYLKLPPYSTREIMKARLLFAITEGRRNYSLS